MWTNEFYEKYLRELPEGLTRATGKLLLKFKGSEMPVSRTRLVMLVAALVRAEYHDEKQFANLDRRVRRAIEILRGAGWLIGNSLSGDGYFMIRTAEEYSQFRASYTSAAYNVMETARSMDIAAARQFGEQTEVQLTLIEVE